MSGRSRRKKLQRAKRISQADSFASPSLESGITTNPPFPFPSSDTITSSSTNEADLEDITSKSEEKLESTTTEEASNKDSGEKETEGNEEKSSSAIFVNQVQPQPLIPCGPMEIKVDSLQKTVDGDESATTKTLAEIKSNCKVSSENNTSDLIRTNESNGYVDSLQEVDESKGDKDNFDCIETVVQLSQSTVQKVKSGGRITIAKSDTIIETREEGSDSETTDIDNSASIHTNKTWNKSSPNPDEGVDSFNKKTEENNIQDLDTRSNKCLSEIEKQSSEEKQFEIQLSDKISLDETNKEPSTDQNHIGQEVHDLSTNKDWNIIIEEDESEDVTTENKDHINLDKEPLLIKIKSYDLPKTSTPNLLHTKNDETNQNQTDFDENKESKQEKCSEHNDVVEVLEDFKPLATPEIIVVEDYKENDANFPSLVELDELNDSSQKKRNSTFSNQTCSSHEFTNKELSPWPATVVVDMGDSTSVKQEQQGKTKNPKWRRAAVKAVQLQETSKNLAKTSNNGKLSNVTNEHNTYSTETLNIEPSRFNGTPEPLCDDVDATISLNQDNEKLLLPPIIFEATSDEQVRKSLSPRYSPPDNWKEHSPSLQLSVISGSHCSLSSADLNNSGTFQHKSNNGQFEMSSSSRPPGSSHSSLLVDMGKVIGVLRSTRNQIPAALRNNPENDSEDSVENENIINSQNISNPENEIDDNRNDYSMPSVTSEIDSKVTNSVRKCESCASESGRSSSSVQKRIGKLQAIATSGVGSSDLDDSLCGDPLMYATFVAPVHQYSTETEPSRQASFNYPSRQPSFKQNSSDAEGGSGVASGAAGDQQGNYSQFPGNLPVPGSRGKSRTPEKLYSKEVQDIYEQVPIDQWPLPPLPLDHIELDAEYELKQQIVPDCVQEVSQEELEQQAHLERMSFISVSSANEEEDDFEDNDQDVSSLSFPHMPPAPSNEFILNQPKSRGSSGPHLEHHQPSHYHHIHQSLISMPPDNHTTGGGREATPMIHKSSLGLDDSNHRPFIQRNEMFPSWSSAGDIVECLPHTETFSSGTVRRKNKRERNRTNPEGNSGTLLRNPNKNENGANLGVGKSSTSLESTSDMPDVTQCRIITGNNSRIPNNIDSYGINDNTKRCKSRSKSRSPTRSNEWLEDDLDIPPPPPPPHQVCHHHQSSLSQMSEQHVHKHHQELSGSEGAAEIVIVHRGVNQPTCSLHPIQKRNKPHLNRNASPDNISESSLSFHENEFASQSNQHSSNVLTKPQSLKHNQERNYSTSTSRTNTHILSKGTSSERGRIEYADKYENRESVRESWGTSSSSDRLTAINKGVPGGNDKSKDLTTKFSHTSRLKDSGAAGYGSQQEKKFGDSPSLLHQKQQPKQQEKVSTIQRQHHHRPKVYNSINPNHAIMGKKLFKTKLG